MRFTDIHFKLVIDNLCNVSWYTRTFYYDLLWLQFSNEVFFFVYIRDFWDFSLSLWFFERVCDVIIARVIDLSILRYH